MGMMNYFVLFSLIIIVTCAIVLLIPSDKGNNKNKGNKGNKGKANRSDEHREEDKEEDDEAA